MKKNIFILPALLCMMLCSCEKQKEFNEDILSGRPVEKLEVSYSVDGNEVKSLSFNNKAHELALQVTVNNDNLNWKLESDKNWCTVKGEGKGSGSVILKIAENEDFSSRSVATLTFVAGQYRGNLLTVDQSGTVFILSQPYFISSVNGGSYEMKVTTAKGMDWEVVQGEWLSAEKSGSSVSGNNVTTVLKMQVAANQDESRFGFLTLSALDGSGSESEIYVSQFGRELDYTQQGAILLGADKDTKLSFIAPSHTISSVDVPGYASYDVTPDVGDTDKVTICLGENLSDACVSRDVAVNVKLNNASATTIALPAITQDFKDAHGLVSSAGFALFASAFNAGGDVSGWTRDGEVVMLQDIDMSDLKTSWVPIGTQQRPFNMTFNGNGYSIKGLKNATCPVFGACDGASIKGLEIASDCSFYYNGSFGAQMNFAALASTLANTQVRSCKVAASINLAGSSTQASVVNFASLACEADASSVIASCDVDGSILLSSNLASGSCVNAAGVVASCNGELSSCNSAVDLEITSSAERLYCGALTSVLHSSATVKNNAFMGTIKCSGNSALTALGGLYGAVEGSRTMDFASDKSSSMGSLVLKGLNNTAANAFAGSMIGMLMDGSALTISSYESTTSIELNCAEALMKAERVAVGGIIGGCASGTGVSLKGTGLVNKGDLTNPCSSTYGQNIRHGHIGGCVGYISGNVELNSCTNSGNIGLEQISAKSNGYSLVMGGIVASVENGSCTISDCQSSGTVLIFPYNNNMWTTFDCNISGGIIGSFDYLDASARTAAKRATITNCEVTGGQWGYRGICGGIAGFASNAEISGCKCSGNMNGTKGPGGINTNNHAYVGGIVGVIENGKVNDCRAVLNIYAGSPGSESAQTGGIAGVAAQAVDFTLCSYFGEMLKQNSSDSSKNEALGGIVGISTGSCKVSGSKFGGMLNNIKISEMNIRDYVSGDGNAVVDSITYWDGQ